MTIICCCISIRYKPKSKNLKPKVPKLILLKSDSCRVSSAVRKYGITDCKCDCYFSQPDDDIGWDYSCDCFYHGYDLYMLGDSGSDLPVFPHYSCAPKHDSYGFLQAFFRMKSFFPDYKISKVLLDSAHDAMPYEKNFIKEIHVKSWEFRAKINFSSLKIHLTPLAYQVHVLFQHQLY